MHVTNKRAPTKDPARERILRKLYRDDNRYVAESLGLAAAPSNRCFHPDSVMRLLDRTQFRYTGDSRFIFICIDAAEGGSDEFAITAQQMINDGQWLVRLCVFLLCAVSKWRYSCRHCRCRCHRCRRCRRHCRCRYQRRPR